MKTPRFRLPRRAPDAERALRLFLAICLLLVATPLAAQHFKGRCENSVILGGEGYAVYRQKLTELRELLAGGRLDAGIELQREIADLQCHNHFQRYYLAELLREAGRLAEVVDVLAELYALGVNDLEQRLAAPSGPLAGVRESGAFRESELARQIEARLAEGDARRADFRQRVASIGPDERPPSAYVAEGACPFECCTFRSWSVLEDTPLVAAPGSDEAVAVARKDTRVEGLTGEVHVAPVPVGVVFPQEAYAPSTTVPKGALVFLLDHLGEGIGRVWYAGRIHEMSTSGEVREHCPHPGESCWGEALEPGALEREHDWWVKVRLEDGRGGWTREANFGEIDGCG